MSLKQLIRKCLNQLIKRNLQVLQEWSWKRLVRRLPATSDGKRLLHVGCGEVNSQEYINPDARPLPHVHTVSKITANSSTTPPDLSPICCPNFAYLFPWVDSNHIFSI